jgi:F0F1-type ATP synthase assembly protein I
MTNHDNNVKKQLFTLFCYQIVVLLIFSLAIFGYFGLTKFFASVMGASAYLLPQLLFTVFISVLVKKQQEFFILGFFIGESCKIIIAAVLCVSAINLLALNHLFAILGFVAGVLSLWLIYGCYLGFGKNLQRI